MSIEIQSNVVTSSDLRPLAQSRPQTKSAQEAPAPTLQPTKTVEVKVDTEKMKKNLDQAIRQLNDVMRDGGRNVTFSMEEDRGTPIILVKNKDTGEVIRQIPNEVVIKVGHSLDAIKGILLNKQI